MRVDSGDRAPKLLRRRMGVDLNIVDGRIVIIVSVGRWCEAAKNTNGKGEYVS